MENKIYRLIFNGEVVDGLHEKDVKKNLASFFKGDVEKLDQLFSGQPIVIKKAVHHQMAVRYKKAFQKAGAILKIEPSAIKRLSESSGVIEIQETSKRQGLMICPKCGFEQEQSDECIRCGLIINKYLEKPSAEPQIYTVADSSILTPTQIQRKNVVTIVLLISIVLVLIALFQKDRLPDKEDILNELYQMPRQTQTAALAFKTEVGNKVYTITPFYGYELHGLVVSYYDSTGWWDITHKFLWKDFINIKDICVLYGFNVRTDAYKEMRFKSGPWTCYVDLPTERAQVQYHHICLSNNHLLADNKQLAKEIMRAERGDQIYIKGYLAAYSHSGGSFFRATSTNRTDTGDGACETIYIEDFKILKKANRFWRFVFSLAVLTMAGSIGLIVMYYGKEFFGYSKKKASLSTKETIESAHAIESSKPKIFHSDDLNRKFKLNVILKLLFLLLLIYLWARLH